MRRPKVSCSPKGDTGGHTPKKVPTADREMHSEDDILRSMKECLAVASNSVPQQMMAAEEMVQVDEIALRDQKECQAKTQDLELKILRDQKECQAKTQDLELKIRRVEGVSTDLIQEQPGFVEMAKRYIHWYHGVEDVIKTMLRGLDIEVVSVRDSNGEHTHHEDILEELSRSKNPLFELLGRDDILFHFRQAKDDRNVMRGLGKGSVLTRPAPDWNAFATRIRGVERALWASVAFFKLEYSRRKEHDREFSKKKQELGEWETNLHTEQQNLEDRESKVQGEEERLRAQEKKIEDTKERKAREEERLRNEAMTKKQLDAVVKNQLKAQDDAIKRAKTDLLEQEKKALEAAKLLKTKTQLTKDNEKLKKDIRDLKNDRADVEKLETKQRNQAAEIRRLEEKARNAEKQQKDAVSYCAAQVIGEKEAFRQSLAKMRDADAVAAKAQLLARAKDLEDTLRSEIHDLVASQVGEVKDRDKLLQNREERIELLETQLKNYESALEEAEQNYKAGIKSLEDAHVQALEAQFQALEAELERMRGLSEASDSKRRRLFFF